MYIMIGTKHVDTSTISFVNVPREERLKWRVCEDRRAACRHANHASPLVVKNSLSSRLRFGVKGCEEGRTRLGG